MQQGDVKYNALIIGHPNLNSPILSSTEAWVGPLTATQLEILWISKLEWQL